MTILVDWIKRTTIILFDVHPNLLSVFKYVMILIAPLTALFYAMLASSMIYGSGEAVGNRMKQNMEDLVLSILFRVANIMVACVIAYKIRTYEEQEYFVARVLISFMITIRISYKLMLNTRTEVIEGGPSPESKLITDMNEPLSSFLDSSEPIVVVVTGANTGIGLQTAKQLASLATQRKTNAKTTIVLACRSIQKGLQAQDIIFQDILSQYGYGNNHVSMEVIELELCSYTSIRKAVQILTEKHPIIHCLINNAGVMMNDYTRTIDNHETTMQANYLGHFLLTTLLLPHIITNPETSPNRKVYYVPRIINVSSSTYAIAAKHRVPLDDLNCTNGTRKYTLFSQYSVSKLCQILFTYTLKYQYPTIFTASLTPGVVRTDVTRNMPWYLQYPNEIFGFILKTLQKTPEQGAWNSVYVSALLSDDSPMNSGNYWLNRHVQPIVYKQKQQFFEEDAIALWYESCKLVGLTTEEMQRIQDLAINKLPKHQETGSGTMDSKKDR